MKKSLFLIPLAAVALASCSDNEPMGVEFPSIPADAEGNVYLSFGLVNSTGLTTRADDEFVAGTGAESKITNVRFLFYDKDGKAVGVKYNTPGTTSNWYDYNPNAEGNAGVSAPGSESPNVEQIVNATIVLNTRDFADQNVYPTQVVALINPTADMGKDIDLDVLKTQFSNYNIADEQNGFLMSSSVYADGSNAALSVEIGNYFYSDIETALAHPVTLYVERVASKVVLGISVPVNNNTNLYPTGEKDYNGNDIYVAIAGWNVTTTVNQTNLFKIINPSWNLGWAWNWAENHRSYWAVNPTLSNADYSYTSWSDATKKAVGGTAYLKENASNDFTTGADPIRASQVILYGTLCNADGTPLPLVEYKLLKYNPNDINQVIYNTLGQKIYKEDGSEINPATDIVFKTSTAVGKNSSATEPNWKGTGTYNVYAQLKEGGKYSLSSNFVDNTASINQSLINTCGPVKFWNGGATYYYIDIAHLNPNNIGNPGAHGVVRNHLYNIDINGLTGLGTPVYDKDEDIIPEHTDKDYGMVAAKINVLSWKVVEQSAELEW